MTLHDIFQSLRDIDHEAQTLLSDAGFTSADGIADSVCLNPDNPDDLFLLDTAVDLMEPFEVLHKELRYLRKPHHGEYTIERFPNGRYGYYDENGYDHVFSCGKSLEAKVSDNYGRQRWVRTRIEHDGDDFYLRGHSSVPLQGLTVRERW